MKMTTAQTPLGLAEVAVRSFSMVEVHLPQAVSRRATFTAHVLLSMETGRWELFDIEARSRRSGRRMAAATERLAGKAALQAIRLVDQQQLGQARLESAMDKQFLNWLRAEMLTRPNDDIERCLVTSVALAELATSGDVSLLDICLSLVAGGFSGNSQELVMVSRALWVN